MRISIHAPTRGATGGKDIIGGASEISIHAPTRGATDECRAWKEKHNAFQSTLPRGERPNCFDHCQGEMDISIHAPTRGATLTDLGYEVQFKISIHAPTRGATTFPGTFRSTYNYFNPRSHEGSDRRYHRPERDPLFQSTLPRGERLLVMLSAYMS